MSLSEETLFLNLDIKPYRFWIVLLIAEAITQNGHEPKMMPTRD